MALGTRLTSVATRIADAVFPRFCVGCGAEGSILCTNCGQVWVPDGATTGEPWFFAHYADPIARGLLTNWKYHFDETAWEVLSRRLHPALSTFSLRLAMAGITAIVPVPLSRERRAERGFDQAERIAHWLSRATRVPVRHLLVRRHVSGHQAERTTEERHTAMALSPFVAAPLLSKGGQGVVGSVLLVDDVWTTGATMHAAIRTLNAAGVHAVTCCTLLKGG